MTSDGIRTIRGSWNQPLEVRLRLELFGLLCCFSAQGKGIFLINKMSQIKKWSRDGKSVPTGEQWRWEALSIGCSRSSCSTTRNVCHLQIHRQSIADRREEIRSTSLRAGHIVQTFEMLSVRANRLKQRSWVSSFRYRLGFGRFCTVKYISSSSDIDNMFVHLTNVSYQKQSVRLGDRHLRTTLIAFDVLRKTTTLSTVVNGPLTISDCTSKELGGKRFDRLDLEICTAFRSS